ncbi:MAG: NADH-quinone oxidoreductase subunit J, partial [Anaerolineae bacterium]
MGSFIVFIILAVIAIGAAIGMLVSRNAVHSALFLVLNFAAIAVFYLVLNAPFIAMVQITVYAGAIMVLFLCVIMLLGAEQLRGALGVVQGSELWQRVL